jgi:hypothetical protein
VQTALTGAGYHKAIAIREQHEEGLAEFSASRPAPTDHAGAQAISGLVTLAIANPVRGCVLNTDRMSLGLIPLLPVRLLGHPTSAPNDSEALLSGDLVAQRRAGNCPC